MKDTLFIPKKCKVGFNLRSDTYTGKLGYIIYHDGKEWRKESSWEKWRQKEGAEIHAGWEYDEKGQALKDGNGRHIAKQKILTGVEPIEFDNVPTEGFVLNRNVGGVRQSYSWNARLEKVRVYDPRGFEFEITIENMLFILQECTSVKGKGLEGNFVYAWNGTSLALLPEVCEEYRKSNVFTKLQDGKVGIADLLPGCSYKTKQQKDLIYLGRHAWHEKKRVLDKEATENYQTRYSRSYGKQHKQQITKKKSHVFVDDKGQYVVFSDLTKLAARNNETCVDNYAELMEAFHQSKWASAPIEFVSKPISIEFPEGKHSYFSKNYYQKLSENEYERYNLTADWQWTHRGHSGSVQTFKGYNVVAVARISLQNGVFETKDAYYYTNHKDLCTREELEAKPWEELFVKLSSGVEIPIKEY